MTTRLGPAAVLVLVGLSAARADDPPTAVRWRTDYNAARKEADEKGLPILLVVGSDNCFYCKKMDATTWRDPQIVPVVAGSFVAVRVDGNAEPALCRALQITLFPTLVVAGPEGKIHHSLSGYQPADQLRDILSGSVVKVKAEQAVKAASGEVPNAARARELLGLARDEFRSERFGNCLDHCEYLAAMFASLPEGKEAASLVAQIKADPDKLKAAADQLAERTAVVQLATAAALAKKGDVVGATAAYEKVIALTPNAAGATTAKAELSRLGGPAAVPVSRTK